MENLATTWVGATAKQISRAVRRGDTTATQVVADHLEQIAISDPAIAAFRVVRAGEAIAEAEKVDDQEDLANLPLAGVPVAVKENTPVAGLPTWHGSAAARSAVAEDDPERTKRRAVLAALRAGHPVFRRRRFFQGRPIRKGDELRDIAVSLEGAVGTLRGFSDAQKELFEAHQAGEIDDRLDSEAFPGSFGVMAEEINALVASHIDVNERVIGIVANYARGDLSEDMERLPGKKAQITAAIDSVKSGMQALTDELKGLVDALDDLPPDLRATVRLRITSRREG